MSRSLAAWVTLMSPAGEVEHFVPGTSESDLPDWAAERITNPAVWDAEAQAVVLGDSAEPDGRVPESSSTSGPPPKAGAGSSVSAWAEYARSVGVVVDADAKRDDIIASCEAAGVSTE